jgi:uncharacterized protein (TIGR03067 family)
MAFSRDGSKLAVAVRRQKPVGFERSIHVWDLAADRELVKLGAHDDTVTRLAFSPLGKLLASGCGFKQEVKVWDTQSGALRQRWEIKGEPRPALGANLLAFSVTGEEVLSLSQGAFVRLAVVSGQLGGEFLPVFVDSYGGCSAVAPLVAVASARPGGDVKFYSFELYIYNYGTAALGPPQVQLIPLESAASAPLVFSGDGKTLCIATKAGPIVAFDTRTWMVRASLDRRHSTSVTEFQHFNKIELTPQGTDVVARVQQQGRLDLEVWSVGQAQTRKLPGTHGTDFALSPGGKVVAVSTPEGVRFVDMTTGQDRPEGAWVDPPPADLVPEAAPLTKPGPYVEVLLGEENARKALARNVQVGQTVKVKGDLAGWREDRVLIQLGELYDGDLPAVSAEQLAKDFAEDKEAAEKKYKKGTTTIVVKGVVKELRPGAFSMVLVGPAGEGGGTDAAAAESKDEANKKDLKALQGTWKYERVKIDDYQATPSTLDGRRLAFADNVMKESRGKDMVEHLVVLGASKKPKQINILDKAQNIIAEGVYELDGDTLKICKGPPTMRPKDFVSTLENMAELSVLKRVKSDAPKGDAAKKAPALKGTWVVEACASNKVTAIYSGMDTIVTFGNKTAEWPKGIGRLFDAAGKGDVKVDTSMSPPTIELTVGGKAYKGIYRIRESEDVNKLDIILAEPGAEAGLKDLKGFPFDLPARFWRIGLSQKR